MADESKSPSLAGLISTVILIAVLIVLLLGGACGGLHANVQPNLPVVSPQNTGSGSQSIGITGAQIAVVAVVWIVVSQISMVLHLRRFHNRLLYESTTNGLPE